MAEGLIENVAFMRATLEELAKIINEQGYSSEYRNGENQTGTKKTPEVDIYNTMIKNYNATMKQLYDMLPEESRAAGDDPVKEWLDKEKGKK